MLYQPKNQLYKIIIPVIPDSINEAMSYQDSWASLAVIKKKWEQLARVTIREKVAEGSLPSKLREPITIKYKMYFTSKMRRDPDNYFLMTKGITDALVREGLIADDDYTRLRFNGIEVIIDPDRPRVEMFIFEPLQKSIIKPFEYEQPKQKSKHTPRNRKKGSK